MSTTLGEARRALTRPDARSTDLEPRDLRPVQLVLLAGAVSVVSAGYGALMPLLPAWLSQQMPALNTTEIARQVGFLSGAYTAGVLIGAPLWGMISDRLGRPHILILGLVGYVVSLLSLLLLPSSGYFWAIYALRAAAGLFVAAVIPIVPALVAAHTPKALRARRFAWLGAASLIGFLFGPVLNSMANILAKAFAPSASLAHLSERIVLVLSAILAAAAMLGLAWSLRGEERVIVNPVAEPGAADGIKIAALWGLSVTVMFVLSGFELGIVLQGKLHADLSIQKVALMFAECAFVMLAVNALLFFTSVLGKVPARVIISVGSLIGVAGLSILSEHRSNTWMYIGVSLTSAGTGLVLPEISFLAAGASRRTLGATMGSLAAASGLGQTLGSVMGGWLFGLVSQGAFGWLALPLFMMLVLVLARPSWLAR